MKFLEAYKYFTQNKLKQKNVKVNKKLRKEVILYPKNPSSEIQFQNPPHHI